MPAEMISNHPSGVEIQNYGQLEQILGKLTLENAFLKKALENALKEQREKKRVHLSLPGPHPQYPKGV
ncbi:unnamed protein product [marine sediment metagenome]|uniref:Uncharacterized protein n=1 Tax=marine sediment metagenome TaxID=412755 RepID=X1JYB8_9ZZZZ